MPCGQNLKKWLIWCYQSPVLAAAEFFTVFLTADWRTCVHITMSADARRASLLVGGNRCVAAILLTDTAAQLCAAFATGRATP
jgi:hypothetical protein